jgi:hypothetical protein
MKDKKEFVAHRQRKAAAHAQEQETRLKDEYARRTALVESSVHLPAWMWQELEERADWVQVNRDILLRVWLSEMLGE